MKIRIILADDHKMMREGLKTLVDEQPDLQVVGEARNGMETVALAARLRPHVVVMDVAMPDLNGIEATRKILAENTSTKVVALSGQPSGARVNMQLKAL